jgi:hypothetical protein
MKKPISVHGLSKRLTKIFSFTGKNAGVNSIRSSYLTYQSEQKRLTVADKKKLATLMRTRKDKIDANYIKILPQNDKKELIDVINQNKNSCSAKVKIELNDFLTLNEDIKHMPVIYDEYKKATKNKHENSFINYLTDSSIFNLWNQRRINEKNENISE